MKMETEVEAKFLDVDIKKFRSKLKSLNAKLVHPEVFMKRRTFDYSDDRLRKIGGWIRVRDEGKKVTMSYKQLNDRSLHGTKEITVGVSDFNKACEFLIDIGFKQKSYQETKREKWSLEGNEITIDTWPWVPNFVEIESKDELALKKIVKKVGFKFEDALHGSVENVYQKDFDVTEDEIDSWESITFIKTPKWLEKKRKLDE